MIDRPNISSIVASQVPDFVREDYPTFIAFLEAYYDFLETQTRVELKSIRDIDTSLDAFIAYFKNEIAYNLPKVVVDERFLMQHIKELYLAKGSEASYKLLFRLLFNKNVEVAYPGRQMLRASDGKWIQENSIFCEVTYGDVYSIVGKTVNVVVSPTKTIQVLVERVSRVEEKINGIPEYSSNKFELHIDRRFFGKFDVGNKVELDDFRSVIIPTTVKVSIKQAGKGFKVGQLYDINSTGYGSKFKVKSIDANGGITNIELIKFGTGYNTEITSAFNAKSDKEYTPAYLISSSPISGGLAYNSTTTDTVDAIYEFGTINFVTYNIDSGDDGNGPALDGSYAGETRSSFSYYNSGFSEDPADSAIIQISIGSLAKYPGYYKNNDGFLDDAMYIQDSKYYQAFSYVLKIDERIEDFKSAVKTMLHPTGMALFADYQIENFYDISANVESILKILSFVLRDTANVTDNELAYKTFNKALNYTTLLNDGTTVDNNASIALDSLITVVTKLLNESTVLNDGTTVDDNTVLATQVDTIDSINFGKALNGSTVLNDGTTVDNNTVVLADSDTLEFGKTLNETSVLNNGTTVDNNSVYAIHTDVLEKIEVGKALDATTLLNDGVTLDDNTSIALDSTYSDITKPLAEDQPLSDEYTSEFGKTLNGTTVLNDGITVDNNAVTLTDDDTLNFGKTLDATTVLNNGTTVDNNTVVLADSDTLNFGKTLDATTVLNNGTTVDNNTVLATQVDTIDSINFGKALDDSQTLADSDTLDFGKTLDNTTLLNDETTVDDNTAVTLDSIASTDVTKVLEYNILNPDTTSSITNSSDQGTGNYGNYVLYLSSRGSSTAVFLGKNYGAIVRGAFSSEEQLSGIEDYLKSKMTNTSSTFLPSTLFSSGEQGAWYDFSDMTTLYQNTTGTIPVTAVEQKVALVLDKSGRGNNLKYSGSYLPSISSRVNRLTETSILSTQTFSTPWYSSTQYVEHTLSFSGTGYITLSGAASGTFYAGTSKVMCGFGPGLSITVTVYGEVLNADLRETISVSPNIPNYQNVISSTNYDTVGFPMYLVISTFGTKMYSNTIDFTSTDKITVAVGVTKYGESNPSPILELSTIYTSNDGSFALGAAFSSSQPYGFVSKGTSPSIASTTNASFKGAISAVLVGIGDISNDISKLRISPLCPTIDTNDTKPYYNTSNDVEKLLDNTTLLNDNTTLDDNSVAQQDSTALETTKYINDSDVNQTESGYIELNPYAADLTWSADIYVGTRVNLF